MASFLDYIIGDPYPGFDANGNFIIPGITDQGNKTSDYLASDGFRFYNYTPDKNTLDYATGLDATQKSELEQARKNALANGDSATLKTIEAIMKYGGPVLLLLGQLGVIKNKTAISIAQIQADAGILSNTLAKTGGSLDPVSLEKVRAQEAATRSSSTDILGIPITYIIVALVLVALYLLLKPQMAPETGKSKK